MASSLKAPVLIVGGGIIGLTLAQALRARSIPFEIYERDSHAAARGPGWGKPITPLL
jgi:2-polyprenyl-6-methoxyphenol hydroxylase-like FAD-dependent oxidoreductase